MMEFNMKKASTSIVAIMTLLLVGCDMDEDKQVIPTPAPKKIETIEQKTETTHTIYLSDNKGIVLTGKHVDSSRRPSKDGFFVHHSLDYDKDISDVEKEAAAALHAAGYTKRVIEEKFGFLKEHFYKKDSYTIGLICEAVNRNGQEKTNLRLYWEEKTKQPQ